MRQPLVPFDTPLEGEGDIIWEYFQHYRDMGPERTKAALTTLKIAGKTRDAGQIGRWAKKFQWDFRAHVYDMANAQKAHEEVVIKREQDLRDYIDKDIDIAADVQQLCSEMFRDLAKARKSGEAVDAQELRAVAMTYRESRMWAKDSLAFTYGDGRTPEHHN